MFRFWFCVVGIYTCFLTWGILQERVTTTKYSSSLDLKSPNGGKFTYFVFLNMIQAASACAIAGIYLLLTGQGLGLPATNKKGLIYKYLQTAVLNTSASPFGYESLKHIDYPTLTLGKSCKLVPVMLMHWILYRKKFPAYKYVSVFIITTGVSLFMLLQPSKSTGIALSSDA